MAYNTTHQTSCANAANVTNAASHATRRRMRWLWFPSLFFGDGMLMSVLVASMVMLRRFGLDNAQTSLCMSLLCIPFVLRPLLEMIVAHFRGTTKVWILTSQFISAMSMWAIAFTIPTGYWLQAMVCFMPFVVVSGIFYNIAAGRFYADGTGGRGGDSSQLLAAMLFRGLAMLFGMGVVVMLAGNMEVVTRSVRYSWSFVFYVMAGMEFFLWLWHSIFLPGGAHPYAARKDLFGLHRTQYEHVVDAVTHGVGNRLTLLFFLLFVLPEGFLVIVGQLFLVDAPHNGGLGFSPQEFGLVKGTVGIVALFVGRRIGTAVLSRWGLRHSLFPMALVGSFHGLAMLCLGYNVAATFSVVCVVVFVGDMALGVSMAAYGGAVRAFARSGRGSTFRRSVALSLMSLTLVGVGMFSGLLQMDIGYRQYFFIAAGLYAVSLVVSVAYCFSRNRHG